MSWWTFQNCPSVGPCWSPQRTGMPPDVRRARTRQPEVESKSLHVKEKVPFSSPPHARSPESQTEHIGSPSATAQRHQKSPRKVKRSAVQGRLYSPDSSSTLAPPIPLLPRLCGVRTAGRRGGSSAPEVFYHPSVQSTMRRDGPASQEAGLVSGEL